MSDFASFKSSFSGDIVTPEDPGYDVAIARWAANATRRAAVVAYVRDAADVTRAIAYARRTGLPIAIRGGGHNAAGASSSAGGLVIDLSRYLNDVRVDPEGKLAYVGGGALWETVDKAGIEHGLATVGGTVNHVRLARSMFDLVSAELNHLLVARLVLEGETFPMFVIAFFVDSHCSLILGGGYGWLSGSYGLAIDNLVQVRPICNSDTAIH